MAKYQQCARCGADVKSLYLNQEQKVCQACETELNTLTQAPKTPAAPQAPKTPAAPKKPTQPKQPAKASK